MISARRRRNQSRIVSDCHAAKKGYDPFSLDNPLRMASFRAGFALALTALAAAACSSRLPDGQPRQTVRMLAGGPIAHDFLVEFQNAMPDASVTMEDGRGSEFVVAALQHGVAD